MGDAQGAEQAAGRARRRSAPPAPHRRVARRARRLQKDDGRMGADGAGMARHMRHLAHLDFARPTQAAGEPLLVPQDDARLRHPAHPQLHAVLHRAILAPQPALGQHTVPAATHPPAKAARHGEEGRARAGPARVRAGRAGQVRRDRRLRELHRVDAARLARHRPAAVQIFRAVYCEEPRHQAAPLKGPADLGRGARDGSAARLLSKAPRARLLALRGGPPQVRRARQGGRRAIRVRAARAAARRRVAA
mmetsp:Transcript_1113/g.3534  ORF Transcript_1113/g.3534 Transcript_1113/m.3534 type:complete len:249 (-) Transcript_1113:647-1393(-)